MLRILRLAAAYRRLRRQGSANSESHEGRSHQRYERLARPTVAMVRDRIAEADTGVARLLRSSWRSLRSRISTARQLAFAHRAQAIPPSRGAFAADCPRSVRQAQVTPVF